MEKAEKHAGMKRCTRCGKLKGKGEFGKQKRYKDGRKYWCKQCEQQYQRAYYLRNHKAIRRNFKYDESHRVFGGVKQKMCRNCIKWKDESEFHRDPTTRDGLNAKCKKCAKKLRKQRRAAKNKREWSRT
jgi:hypothetical protein